MHLALRGNLAALTLDSPPLLPQQVLGFAMSGAVVQRHFGGIQQYAVEADDYTDVEGEPDTERVADEMVGSPEQARVVEAGDVQTEDLERCSLTAGADTDVVAAVSAVVHMDYCSGSSSEGCGHSWAARKLAGAEEADGSVADEEVEVDRD